MRTAAILDHCKWSYVMVGCIALVIATCNGQAWAQAAAISGPQRPIVRPMERPGLLLAPNEVEASATVEVNLSIRAVAQPWSVAPDFRVGVAPNVDVGITSSSHSLSRLAAGSGICVGGKANRCDGPYRGVALDARYLALSHGSQGSDSSGQRTIQLALRARFLLREFGPLKPALLVGAIGRWRGGRLAVTTDPYIQFGLLNRNRGNRHRVTVPAWFTVHPTCGLAVSLYAAFDSEFAVIRDGWRGAVGAEVAALITPRVTAELRAGFPTFIGPQNTHKLRVISISATLHAW